MVTRHWKGWNRLSSSSSSCSSSWGRAHQQCARWISIRNNNNNNEARVLSWVGPVEHGASSHAPLYPLCDVTHRLPSFQFPYMFVCVRKLVQFVVVLLSGGERNLSRDYTQTVVVVTCPSLSLSLSLSCLLLAYWINTAVLSPFVCPLYIFG